MSEHEFTAEERRWINRSKRLAASMPKELRLYILDGNCLYVCKAGVPSNDLIADVVLRISPGCVLTDIHDDWNNGLS